MFVQLLQATKNQVDGEQLRHYPGGEEWKVYGETAAGFTDKLVQNLKLTPQDVFLDFGSGLGQVVLQVACQTGCRGLGIEVMPARHEHALLLHKRLRDLLPEGSDR